MRVDLHNHTTLCNHAVGSTREYINRAIDLGIDIYGFSDHAPMNFDSYYRMGLADMNYYENDIRNLKDEFKDKIEILLGYEVDYLEKYLEQDVINAKVDYLIGSIHFLDEWGFDNPEFIGHYKNVDIDRIWEDYFLAIKNLAKSGLFQIVGHIDLMKLFNFLPKKDIKILAKDAISEIKKANMAVEINGAGFRKDVKEQYPSSNILEMLLEYDIPITFGSDAHSIEQVGFMLDNNIEVAKSLGFSKFVIFRDKEMVLIKF